MWCNGWLLCQESPQRMVGQCSKSREWWCSGAEGGGHGHAGREYTLSASAPRTSESGQSSRGLAARPVTWADGAQGPACCCFPSALPICSSASPTRFAFPQPQKSVIRRKLSAARGRLSGPWPSCSIHGPFVSRKFCRIGFSGFCSGALPSRRRRSRPSGRNK